METIQETPTVIAATFHKGSTSVEPHRFGLVLAGVARFASTDQARGAITGVQVVGDGETLTFTATDSYRLLTVRVVVQAGPVGTWLLPAKQVAAVAKECKQKKIRYVAFVSDGDAVRFDWETTDGGQGSTRIPVVSDVTFADWGRLFSVDETDRWPSGSVRVNGDLVGDVFATVGSISDHSLNGVTIERLHDGKPMHVTATADNGGVQVRALVMPLRG